MLYFLKAVTNSFPTSIFKVYSSKGVFSAQTCSVQSLDVFDNIIGKGNAAGDIILAELSWKAGGTIVGAYLGKQGEQPILEGGGNTE